MVAKKKYSVNDLYYRGLKRLAETFGLKTEITRYLVCGTSDIKDVVYDTGTSLIESSIPCNENVKGKLPEIWWNIIDDWFEFRCGEEGSRLKTIGDPRKTSRLLAYEVSFIPN